MKHSLYKLEGTSVFFFLFALRVSLFSSLFLCTGVENCNLPKKWGISLRPLGKSNGGFSDGGFSNSQICPQTRRRNSKRSVDFK